tara:strand:- start:7033 stop:7206 length:174 start_codon:yes stop_codon:yes gene_type:complete
VLTKAEKKMSYRIGNWYVYHVEANKEWVARSQDQVHVFSRKKDAVDFANTQFMIGAK